MSFVLTVNGQRRAFDLADAPVTLARLVEMLDLSGAALVAEVDGAVVASADFGKTPLVDGATVELVRFVGGG